jgi:phage terminase small subunit
MATSRKTAGNAPASPKAEKALTKRPDVDVFIAEYVLDRNGKRAAIAAGYAPNSATVQASRLLTTDKVRKAVNSHREEAIAKVQRDTGITLERTLREIAAIAYCDLEAIRGLGLDKSRALDMLMKHLGGYEVDNKQQGDGLANLLAGIGRSAFPIVKDPVP